MKTLRIKYEILMKSKKISNDQELIKEYHYYMDRASEFGTYRLREQRRFRRACACAQSRQNLRCSLIQAVSQEEPSDRKPALWSL